MYLPDVEAILALERDVDLVANARLDEVLRRLALFQPPSPMKQCERHVLVPRLTQLGIQVTRMRRRLDYDGWATPESTYKTRVVQLKELVLHKKSISRVFHSTPCTCKE